MLRLIEEGDRSRETGARIAVAIALLFCGVARGTIFPDRIGTFEKGSPKTIAVPDQALYDEYGIQATEQAEYISPEKRFTATAWRFRESTGAMAMFEARRPSGATPADVTKLSVRTSDGVIFAYGNYVFQLTGAVPPPADMAGIYADLPQLEQSPLPALMTFLPKEGLVPNSERYIIGPVSLERFEPRIAPSVAAFHVGCEAQLGKYRTAKGLMTLAIFHYPSPSLARDRYHEFEKIAGAVVRRVGALIAITIAPPDADAAERVLSRVRYETNLTWNDKVPVNEIKSTARFILDVFTFAGLLIVVCLAAGVGFGGFRIVAKKLGRKQDPDAMITLGLSNK